jgi:hypothetical protein
MKTLVTILTWAMLGDKDIKTHYGVLDAPIKYDASKPLTQYRVDLWEFDGDKRCGIRQGDDLRAEVQALNRLPENFPVVYSHIKKKINRCYVLQNIKPFK